MYILDMFNRQIYPHDGYAKRKSLEHVLLGLQVILPGRNEKTRIGKDTENTRT